MRCGGAAAATAAAAQRNDICLDFTSLHAACHFTGAAVRPALCPPLPLSTFCSTIMSVTIVWAWAPACQQLCDIDFNARARIYPPCFIFTRALTWGFGLSAWVACHIGSRDPRHVGTSASRCV